MIDVRRAPWVHDATPANDPLAARGVAYVLDEFPIRSERFVEREIESLRNSGLRVPLCLLRHHRIARSGQSPSEGESHRVNMRSLVRALPAEALPLGSREALRWRLVARSHANALAARQPALVHAHFATTPAIVARLLAAKLGVPWGVSVHARDVYAQAATSFAERIEGAAYVIACSPAAAQAVRERAGSGVPVFVVHHGLTLASWPRPASDARVGASGPRIIAVGRFVEKKNFVALVQACALLKERHPALRCALVGDGPQRSELQRAIARSAAPVELVPWQDERALQLLYRESTLLVAPGVVTADGDRDNISNVIVEAMASGLPVIASEVARVALGSRDARALIVAEPSPLGLANAIEGALGDRSLLEALRETGRELVERRFDSARNARQLIEIFRVAANEGAQRDTPKRSPEQSSARSDSHRRPDHAV